jgi:Spy/CpxP family protein refolding chaperone
MSLRIGTLALGGLVALGSVAFAQEEPAAPAAPEAPKLSRGRQRELDRLKRDLGLSDSQVAQITKIWTDAETATQKLLTADQKTKLDEQGDRGGRGGRGAFGGGGPGGGMGGMMGGMADRILEGLTTELGLTADQQTQAKKIMDETQAAMQEAMAAARETGDWASIRDTMMKAWEGSSAKLRAILTPEQQTKYDEYRQQMEGRFGGMGGGFGGPGGRDRGGRGERGTRGGGSAEERLRAVLADLKLSEDERLVLEGQIKAVLEAQEAARRGTQTARDALRDLVRAGGAGAEAVAGQVQAVRDAEKAGTKSVTDAQAALRDLVTVEQEAILLAHGVLQ